MDESWNELRKFPTIKSQDQKFIHEDFIGIQLYYKVKFHIYLLELE